MTTISKFEKDFTSNIMGYSAMGMILSTCLGSIAVMGQLITGHNFVHMLLVFLIVVVCSVHNAAILTLQKPIVIYRLLILSTLTSTLVIIGNLIF